MSSRTIKTEELLHRKLPSLPTKITNTCVVYILQAACMRRLLSVIIVGYVRFLLKLNLEAILERAILIQKISSGHQNERSTSRLWYKEVGLPLVSCSTLFGSVTHVAGKFGTGASCTSSL